MAINATSYILSSLLQFQQYKRYQIKRQIFLLSKLIQQATSPKSIMQLLTEEKLAYLQHGVMHMSKLMAFRGLK
jgi:hypothetical protein